MKLTSAQQRVLVNLDYEVDVYVFINGKDDYTFSYFKDNTCARVYTTLTAKSLIKSGICEIVFCYVEDALDNCVGVLRRVDV